MSTSGQRDETPDFHIRDILLPWRAASTIYGPYGVAAMREAFRQGKFGAEAEVAVDDQLAFRVVLDPLPRALVPVRAWLGLGVIIFAMKVIADPDLAGRIEDIWYHGAITMVLGPFGVLLGIAFLLVLAGRGHRRAALRRTRRSTGIAMLTVLLSVGVFGLQLPVLRQSVETVMDAVTGSLGAVWGLVSLVVGPWLFVFGVCSVYLMHRNGFSTHSHPYLRPIVASWLSFMVAAVELSVGSRTGLTDTRFVAATLAGPVLVVALSAGEAFRLHRLGVTLGS